MVTNTIDFAIVTKRLDDRKKQSDSDNQHEKKDDEQKKMAIIKKNRIILFYRVGLPVARDFQLFLVVFCLYMTINHGNFNYGLEKLS